MKPGRLLRLLRPPSDRSWILLLPVVPVWLAWIGVVQAKHGFSLLDPGVGAMYVEKLARDGLLLVVITGSLLLVPWVRRGAWLFIAFWLVLSALDITLYALANALLERPHLAVLDLEYLLEFLDAPLTAMLGSLVLLIVASAWLLAVCRRRLAGSSVVRWAALLGILLALASAGRPGRDVDASFPEDRERCLLSYASRSSLLNFVEVVAGRTSEIELRTDLTPYRGVISDLSLPLGSSRPPPLGLKPFRKIVLVFSESLSLNLLHPYGDGLEAEFSPFYSSSFVRERTFENYWSCGLTTLEGMLASLHSHPNPDLPARGLDENSFVRELKEQGFRTIFVRGDPATYPPREALLSSSGFDEIRSRAHFEADPQRRRFIRGLGVYDRILYDEVVRVLVERREEKVLVAVLGVDTHLPGGRVLDYGDLEYPAVPPGLRGAGIGKALRRSAFCHDYDVGNLVKRLKTRGLWTEDLLLILTADHCIPCETDLIPGESKGFNRRIPLVLLTPQDLPPLPRRTPGSQLDLGPTVLHLLDLPAPPGCWGESLFAPVRKGVYVSHQQGALVVEQGGRPQIFALPRPRTPTERDLLQLFRTLFVR